MDVRDRGRQSAQFARESNPVIRTKQRGCAFKARPFCFIRMVGFEIGRKLRSNLSVGPNSPVDCLSAKAATGGNPVCYSSDGHDE